MKLSIPQKALADGLRSVRPALPSKLVFPILQCVLVTAGEGEIRLAASDLSTGLTAWLPADVEEPGEIAIPGALAADIVAGMPSGTLTLSATAGRAELRCGASEASLSLFTADDYPRLPEATKPLFRITAEEFVAAVARVAGAAATDNSRPVLQGVHCSAEGDTLTLAAADGFQLAVLRVPLAEPAAAAVQVLIPATALRAGARLLGDAEGVVSVATSANGMTVVLSADVPGGRAQVSAQGIAGVFPEYERLLRVESKTTITADGAALLAAVRYVGVVVSGDDNRITRFQVDDHDPDAPVLLITARDDERGDQRTEVPVTLAGEPQKIAFSGRYLASMLGACGDGPVEIGLDGPSIAGMFRSADGRLRGACMPIFVAL